MGRQTDGQIDRWTGVQINRQTDGQTERRIDIKVDVCVVRETNILTAGACTIKLITSVIVTYQNKLECLPLPFTFTQV